MNHSIRHQYVMRNVTKGRPPRSDQPQRLTLRIGKANKRKVFKIASSNGVAIGYVIDRLILDAPDNLKLGVSAK